MKIVIISDWYSEKMGYAENCLPKALASLGHEVHVITANVQTYFNSPFYKETYEPFIGPGIVACETKSLNGFTLHRLPFGTCRGRLFIKGLVKSIANLRPQVVQTFEISSLSTYSAALVKPLLDYKLFLESHIHASVFPLANKHRLKSRECLRLIPDFVLGRAVSLPSEKCYPISADAAEIAIHFFGIQPRKVDIYSLGVDTDVFMPPFSESSRKIRAQLRSELGFVESDIVCVYTGRFSQDKDPFCLTKAIGILRERDRSFHGLFIGDGPQLEDIRKIEGCVVHPFVPFAELPPFYWAADIGIWPRQESTSQLDAAACGLPIVISNRVRTLERIEGNGLTYVEGSPDDLARKLRTLTSKEVREELGSRGAMKITDHFSWKLVAAKRAKDYETALKC